MSDTQASSSLHGEASREDIMSALFAQLVMQQANMAMMLLGRDATVTICHSRTKDLAALTRQADVVVAAVGKRNVLTADMVKPGAVVIDVGMNRNDEGKLCGDVDFAGVKEVAGSITPVPGGVGPMTRAMLLVNTIEAAERSGR